MYPNEFKGQLKYSQDQDWIKEMAEGSLSSGLIRERVEVNLFQGMNKTEMLGNLDQEVECLNF